MCRASELANTVTFGANLRKSWRNLGYAVGEDRVCASRFGVPQYRRRSVLLAIRGERPADLAQDLQVPTADPDAPSLSAKGAIDHLPVLEAGGGSDDVSNHVCRNLTEVNRRRLMSVKPGDANWGFAETQFGDLSLPCHRRLAAKGQKGFGTCTPECIPTVPHQP